MEVIKLLLGNYTAICISIGLGIIITTNKNFDKKTTLSFSIFLCIILGCVITETIEYRCSKWSYPSALRYIASAFGYVLRPASIAILICILLRRKKTGIFLWIPLACVAIIAFTTPFTHLMFWFSEKNDFTRGPLTYISHILSLFYLFLLIFLTIKRHKYITSWETFVVLFSSFVCVLATILETWVPDFRNLIIGGMAVSCVLYYIVIYAETYKVDFLTGLLNRRSLYINADKLKNKQFSVISVDLNSLKEINDTQGHSAGDRALKCLANILVSNSEKNYFPYRVGGDEFIILGKELKNEAIQQFIDCVREKLKKENLMASFGYAFYHAGDNFDDIYNQADAQMYMDKGRYKNRRISNE